jgi:hypothetical protein
MPGYRNVMTRHRAAALLLATVALVCPACSQDKPCYPVHGKVLFDGQPVRGAILVFHPLDDPDPNAIKPRAFADREGNFKVTTFRADDGAPAGNYAVTVVWQGRGGGGQGTGGGSAQGQRPGRGQGRGMGGMGGTRRQWPDRGTAQGPGRGRGQGRGTAQGPGRQRSTDRQALQAAFPARYQSPDTSGLRIEVLKQDNELEPFNLEK